MHSGVGAISLDISFCHRIPDLGPLAVLSPAIGAINQMLLAMRLVTEGRSDAAREVFLTLLERLEQPDGCELGELYHRSMRLGALYVVGLIEVSRPCPGDAGMAV